MSNLYFTSDLHLGHANMAKRRKYDSLAEHDDHILHTIAALTKRDILYIVGDAVWTDIDALRRLGQTACCKVLIAGNHDEFDAIHYLANGFTNVRGALKHHGFWITHIPIHPFEMREAKGNIHGHVHEFSDTPDITDPKYFNVNWELHGRPISLDEIKKGMGL